MVGVDELVKRVDSANVDEVQDMWGDEDIVEPFGPAAVGVRLVLHAVVACVDIG
jgi:uncharacterized Zn finger protein